MSVLLSGEGDSPPEDADGPWGFASFLKIISDPKNQQYKEMMEWAQTRNWESFKFE